MFCARYIPFLAAAFLMLTTPVGHAESPQRIEITARRFTYNPSTISVKKNEPVVLVLRSTDVTHGLKIEEFQIKTEEIKKGKDTEIRFTPEESGHYVGKCAHFCGKGHGTMTLNIEVLP